MKKYIILPMLLALICGCSANASEKKNEIILNNIPISYINNDDLRLFSTVNNNEVVSVTFTSTQDMIIKDKNVVAELDMEECQKESDLCEVKVNIRLEGNSVCTDCEIQTRPESITLDFEDK